MEPRVFKNVRCQGCKALERTDSGYNCKLKIPINSRLIKGKHIAPRPSTACYKPRNLIDLSRVQQILYKRAKRYPTHN